MAVFVGDVYVFPALGLGAACAGKTLDLRCQLIVLRIIFFEQGFQICERFFLPAFPQVKARLLLGNFFVEADSTCKCNTLKVE